MSKSGIAAVGAKDAVMAFGALGITVRATNTAEETARAVFELAQEKYAVIFITEEEAEKIPETLSRYKSQMLPAIIPIPGSAGASGVGMQSVRANVEKAVGADILLREEG